jgi:hypothetical protein
MTKTKMTQRAAVRLACLACALGAVLDVPEARAEQSAGDRDRAATAHTAASILRDAAASLEAGAYQRAADLARGIVANPDVPATDRAEAWRLYGLASFFLEQHAEAEQAFLAYLKLDIDGRLDPALVPPEAIVFFEDVRARHAAELRKYRPGPERRRYSALNLLPPAGQFQNGHRAKGWVLAGVGGLALATNVGTYMMLRSWCDENTGVCKSGDESRAGPARSLRTINTYSGVLFLGAMVYGVYDGYRNFRPNRPRPPRASLQVVPGPDGGMVSVHVTF